MKIEFLDLTIVLPAFLAGAIVLATHVPLGIQILRRGIVFIDLALAQIAALGVIIAGLLDFDPQGIPTQLAAAGAALERLDSLVSALEAYRGDVVVDAGLADALGATRTGFEAALDDYARMSSENPEDKSGPAETSGEADADEPAAEEGGER